MFFIINESRSITRSLAKLWRIEVLLYSKVAYYNQERASIIILLHFPFCGTYIWYKSSWYRKYEQLQ